MWINVKPLRSFQLAPHEAGEMQMENENNVSALIVGLTVAVFGLIGLFLISGAADSEMYVFGASLVVFAVLFDFGLVRRHFDRQDVVVAATREATNV